MACEIIACCQFLKDKMKDMPKSVDYIKSKLCLGDYHSCARYRIYKKQNGNSIPLDMFPVNNDEVNRVIQCLRGKQPSEGTQGDPVTASDCCTQAPRTLAHGNRDFDARAATWDERPMTVQLAREITAAILDEVPLSRHMTALDYGCGSGLLTLGVQPHVGRIVGVDSSHAMLDVLAKKVQVQGLDNVYTRLINPSAQDCCQERFDLIVSNMTLHHVCDVAALVSTFVKVLAPDGWLALADLESEDGSFHDESTGVCHHGFERCYIERLLTENGCCDVRVIPAAIVHKADPEGGERPYPVFLAVGRKGTCLPTGNP